MNNRFNELFLMAIKISLRGGIANRKNYRLGALACDDPAMAKKEELMVVAPRCEIASKGYLQRKQLGITGRSFLRA